MPTQETLLSSEEFLRLDNLGETGPLTTGIFGLGDLILGDGEESVESPFSLSVPVYSIVIGFSLIASFREEADVVVVLFSSRVTVDMEMKMEKKKGEEFDATSSIIYMEPSPQKTFYGMT